MIIIIVDGITFCKSEYSSIFIASLKIIILKIMKIIRFIIIIIGMLVNTCFAQVMTNTTYFDGSLPNIETNPDYGFVYPVNADILYESDYSPTYSNRYFMSLFGPRYLSTSSSSIEYYDFHQGMDVTHTVSWLGVQYDEEDKYHIVSTCDGYINEVIDGTEEYLETLATGRSVRVNCDSSFRNDDWGKIFIAYRHLSDLHTLADSAYSYPDNQVWIAKGDTIGIVGESGYTSTVHLHYSLQRYEEGTPTTNYKNVHPKRIFPPDFATHLHNILDSPKFKLLESWVDSSLFRIFIPYNQMCVKRIEITNTSYNKLFDYEDISDNTDRDNHNIIDGMEVFAYSFNRGSTALARYNSTKDDMPAIYPASPNRDINIYFHPITDDSTVYIMDIMLRGLPVDYDILDFTIKMSDIYGNVVEGNFPNEWVWDGSEGSEWAAPDNWDRGSVPTSEGDVTIPDVVNDPVISTTDLQTVISLEIESGATLTVGDESKLTVSSNLSNSGTLTLESTATGTASLINSTESVTATVQRYVPSDNTWHFLSVPFENGTMPEICDGDYAPIISNFPAANATYDFYYLDEEENTENWINLKTSGGAVNTTDFGDPPRFVNGKGYLVAYSGSFTGSTNKSTTDILTAGNVTIPLTSTNLDYNLVGNPYPSSIDWKASSGWTRDVITTYESYNMWIWNGSSGQFGAYNSSSDSDAGTNGVTRYIAPGQAFYVKASSAGNLEMTDEVRVHSTQSWLKNVTEFNTFRMIVSGEQNQYQDEIVIEFGHEENQGGAEKLNSMYSEAPSLSTNKEGEQFSIDFRSDPDSQSSIPLYFSCGVDGIYTLNTNLSSNFETIILEDLLLNVKVDLNINPSYSFAYNSNDQQNRFLLHFSPVGIEDLVTTSPINIFAANGKVEIRNNKPIDAQVRVYNTSGQLLSGGRLNNESSTSIKISNYRGPAMVSIITNSNVINKKVIVR